MRKIPTMTAGEVCSNFAGRKVFVYFNLHNKKWSVKDCRSGRVLCHAPSVQVMQAVGKVSEAGRQRVLRERRKNVHAGIVGYVPVSVTMLKPSACRYITYNPYKNDCFVYRAHDGRNVWDTDEKFVGAPFVNLVNRRVLAGFAICREVA